MPEATGVILTGDMNVHHARWLKYSNGNTAVGADLRITSENFGMQQIVREPIRGQYLWDLYLTDVAGTKMEVGQLIADHKFLLACVPLPDISALQIKRERFNLRRANWTDLKQLEA